MRECAEGPILFLNTANEWLTMEAEEQPLDAVSAATLVVRATEDVDRRTDEDSNRLLTDLLCAAWPSRSSQDQ